jgi:hypothetical protein
MTNFFMEDFEKYTFCAAAYRPTASSCVDDTFMIQPYGLETISLITLTARNLWHDSKGRKGWELISGIYGRMEIQYGSSSMIQGNVHGLMGLCDVHPEQSGARVAQSV